MAPQLKLFFDETRVRQLGAELARAWPDFPLDSFVAQASEGLDGLELMDRASHIARAMRASLPADFDAAIDVLLASAGPPIGHTDGQGMAPFHYLPHLKFVGDHGRDHFESAMRAQYVLTQRFSAEFTIRVFLEHAPEQTLARLAEWVSDPNPHIRRLVSEGTRPRLPWASRLRRFQEDPRPAIVLLEQLKDDPALYVRRSVANHLNDIGKDHPELLLDIAERWSRDATPERRWIVSHALRSSVKKGDARALAVRGFAGGEAVQVVGTVGPERLPMGGSFRVDLQIVNTSAERQSVVLDLAVHYVKANGAARPKVFKGRDLHLEPGARTTLTRAISTADLSTRRHHPGRHAVEVRVNGRVVPIGAVDLLPATA